MKANAQTINSVSVVPANPTTNDSIYVTAISTFGYAACSPHTQGFTVTTNTIDTWALHCLGMLTVICTDTDTFAVGYLPAGIYTANYQLDEGHGSVPCSPGIVPGPSSSITFTVSAMTSVAGKGPLENHVRVFPNPVKDKLTFTGFQLCNHCMLEFFDVLGNKVFQVQITEKAAGNKPETILDVSELNPGIYFLKVNDEKSQQIIRIIKM